MKTLAAELAFFFRGRARANLKLLLGYAGFLLAMMLTYSLLFQYVMMRVEGREFSFVTGLYWTITVMTTLGFGDITFHTDAGRAFAAVVTLSGLVFLLIVLPFGLISLFVAPWTEERLKRRLSRALPASTRGHVIVCGWSPVSLALVRRLDAAGVETVVATPDHAQAVRLQDGGVRVVYGAPSDPEVLESLRVGQARAVVANLRDADNVNVVLTTRAVADTPVVAVAADAESAELLGIAGAAGVVPLTDILAGHLAVRSTTRGARSHILGSYAGVVVAEVPLGGTPSVGRTLGEVDIPARSGAAVAGVLERGRFSLPGPSTLVSESTVVVLVGSRSQLEAVEPILGGGPRDESILVIGHGSVGCAAAGILAGSGVPFRLVDKDPTAGCGRHDAHVGDATRSAVLHEAGAAEASGIIVTTNDDGANVLLTLACRHLNPGVRLVSRANRDENVRELYAAGADFVVSRASVGAALVMAALEGHESVVVTEGVSVFWQPVPPDLVGMPVSAVRSGLDEGAAVVALLRPGGSAPVDTATEAVMEAGATLVLIGGEGAQAAFVSRYGEQRR